MPIGKRCIMVRILQTIVSIVLIGLLVGCKAGGGGFDRIRNFRPEDKYFGATLKSLHFVIEVSEISKVDSVFGMITRAYELPTSARGCKDGVYTGESPYDAYDYKHSAKLEIRGEKIVSVEYDEVNMQGKGKQHDRAYGEEMSSTGTTPAEAYPVYEDALLEHQDVLEVDAVTGATYSLYRFRYAVVMALIKASL